MMKKLFRIIKAHVVMLTIAFLIGAIAGSVVTYFVEENKVEFWKERFTEANELNQTLEAKYNQTKKRNNQLVKENKKIRQDLGISILSSIRSNYYNLKALKSEDYSKQLYYNEMEYRSNLVPRALGEKWDINIFQPGLNRELKHVIDSIANEYNKK
jgi:cell division protein FtsB